MDYKSFNSTGRDDSTTDVIRPKGDGRRKMIFAAIVIAGAIGLCLYGFSQTPLNPFAHSEEGSHAFSPGNRDISKPSD
jgi:hypothetical protein